MKVIQNIICPYCGRDIRPVPGYCVFCGRLIASLEGVAKADTFTDPDETMRICQSCGAYTPPYSRYCYACGKLLRGTPPARNDSETGPDARGDRVNRRSGARKAYDEAIYKNVLNLEDGEWINK